jgi:hypothetical protein
MKRHCPTLTPAASLAARDPNTVISWNLHLNELGDCEFLTRTYFWQELVEWRPSSQVEPSNPTVTLNPHAGPAIWPKWLECLRGLLRSGFLLPSP